MLVLILLIGIRDKRFSWYINKPEGGHEFKNREAHQPNTQQLQMSVSFKKTSVLSKGETIQIQSN